MNKPDKDIVITIRWDGQSGHDCHIDHTVKSPDFLQLLNMRLMCQNALEEIEDEIDNLRVDSNK